MAMRRISDGSMITAMRVNAGLTIEQLAGAVDYKPALLRILEAKRGLLAGPMPRKILRHLTRLRAHERSFIAKVCCRETVCRKPIAWDYACGAKTRKGPPCRLKATYASGRCKLHGGLSTGPRTEEGKERIRQGQYRRRVRERLVVTR